MPSTDILSTQITRRNLIKRAAVGGIALSAAELIAACGGSTSTRPLGTGTSATSSGTLRIGLTGGGASDTLDAHSPVTDPDFARVNQLFEPLALFDSRYDLQMVLAESIEQKSQSEWIVKLKAGLKFHNGKPVTADDVIFTIRRIVNPKSPKNAAQLLSDVDANGLKQLDSLTVSVPLKTPNGSFPEFLGEFTEGIVPVGYDPRHPIGTGPFKFQSFTPGQQSVFVRNPHYWRPNEPYVDTLVLIDFADDTARVNALLSGAVEAISSVPDSSISTVQQNSGLTLLESQTGSWAPFTMRVDRAPFSDVRVRQALRLAIDRPQLVEQVLLGHGRVGNDLYAPYDPDYDASFPQRRQDVEQAKSLLKSAGQSDLRVQLVTSPIYQSTVAAATTLAQQVSAAGIRVSLDQVTTGTFYGPNYLQWPFTQDFWFTRNYLPQAAFGTAPGSAFNETHWSDPQWVSLYRQARAASDAAKRRELIHAAQQIEYDRGGYIVWGFINQIDAYSNKVIGFEESKTGMPLSGYQFRTLKLLR